MTQALKVWWAAPTVLHTEGEFKRSGNEMPPKPLAGVTNHEAHHQWTAVRHRTG